jgi:hypothetical protein
VFSLHYESGHDMTISKLRRPMVAWNLSIATVAFVLALVFIRLDVLTWLGIAVLTLSGVRAIWFADNTFGPLRTWRRIDRYCDHHVARFEIRRWRVKR